MLEAIRPSWRKLRVLLHLSFVGIVMLVMVRVLGYATITVVGWHEAVEAAADDTFAMLTGDVGDAGNRAAVLALGRVRGEGDHATTTCNMNVSSALFVKKKKKKTLPRRVRVALTRTTNLCRAVLGRDQTYRYLPQTGQAKLN